MQQAGRASAIACSERAPLRCGFLVANGGRAAFASWCRQAAFTLPAELPETLDIYRGTMGCSPAEAATGLHWSLELR